MYLAMGALFLYFVYGIFSFIEVSHFNKIGSVNIFLYGIAFWILLRECFSTLKL